MAVNAGLSRREQKHFLPKLESVLFRLRARDRSHSVRTSDKPPPTLHAAISLILFRSVETRHAEANSARRATRTQASGETGDRMIIGVPKEVKDHESRVGVTPAGSRRWSRPATPFWSRPRPVHSRPSSTTNTRAAGAEMVGSAYDVWRLSDMIVKVKEPVEKEYKHFREGLVLFTYLHLAPLKDLTDALLEKKVVGIAYETVRDRMARCPCSPP